MRHPINLFHPGEILQEEFLELVGITQTAFAEELGWTSTRLNELIKGKRGISADSALDLVEVSARYFCKVVDESASDVRSG